MKPRQILLIGIASAQQASPRARTQPKSIQYDNVYFELQKARMTIKLLNAETSYATHPYSASFSKRKTI